MATTTTVPKTYHIMHPDSDIAVPVDAAQVKYWREGNSIRGLVVQIPGEDHTRHLTFEELAEAKAQAKEYERVETSPIKIFYQNTVQTVPDLKAAAEKLEKLYEARIKASARDETGREVGCVFENDGKLTWVCENDNE